MNTYNVVVTVSTTVCIDAESPDDAIEKVSQALNVTCSSPVPKLQWTSSTIS